MPIIRDSWHEMHKLAYLTSLSISQTYPFHNLVHFTVRPHHNMFRKSVCLSRSERHITFGTLGQIWSVARLPSSIMTPSILDVIFYFVLCFALSSDLVIMLNIITSTECSNRPVSGLVNSSTLTFDLTGSCNKNRTYNDHIGNYTSYPCSCNIIINIFETTLGQPWTWKALMVRFYW